MKTCCKFTTVILVGLVAASFLALKLTDFGAPYLEVPNLQTPQAEALVAAAREQIDVVTKYDGTYFPADEIPEDSGVCTDVIWRALAAVNYDLRENMEEDISKNPNDYPTSPPLDSNVNFRRVKTIKIFLDKYAEKLPMEVVPHDVENLSTWQGGDLVTFARLETTGLEHIAIVSDKRLRNGVPLLIHNHGHGTLENNLLLDWPAEITGHYRFP